MSGNTLIGDPQIAFVAMALGVVETHLLVERRTPAAADDDRRWPPASYSSDGRRAR